MLSTSISEGPLRGLYSLKTLTIPDNAHRRGTTFCSDEIEDLAWPHSYSLSLSTLTDYPSVLLKNEKKIHLFHNIFGRIS